MSRDLRADALDALSQQFSCYRTLKSAEADLDAAWERARIQRLAYHIACQRSRDAQAAWATQSPGEIA